MILRGLPQSSRRRRHQLSLKNYVVDWIVIIYNVPAFNGGWSVNNFQEILKKNNKIKIFEHVRYYWLGASLNKGTIIFQSHRGRRHIFRINVISLIKLPFAIFFLMPNPKCNRKKSIIFPKLSWPLGNESYRVLYKLIMTLIISNSYENLQRFQVTKMWHNW